MTSDLDRATPTSSRQDDAIVWRRPHPGFILVELAGILRGLVFPFVVVFFTSDGFRDPFSTRNLVMAGLFAAIIVLSLLWNFLEWRFFRYALAPDRVIVHTGWISRQERSVPYQRIQGVDVIETPSYRLLGLARLRVETASGGSVDSLKGSEVDIKAIDRDEAARIREHLLRARQIARTEALSPGDAAIDRGQAAPGPAVEGELVRAFSLRELLLAGAAQGTAIAVASSELEELLSIAHRVAVVNRGRIVGIQERGAFDRQQLAEWFTSSEFMGAPAA